MKKTQGLYVLLLIGIGMAAQAAIKPMHFKVNKLNAFYDSGVFIGGESGKAFSILNVERKNEKTGERIVINYGDEGGRKLMGKTGFFHVSLEQNPPRLVVDLSQVQRTGVDEKKLAAIFRNSANVKSTEMTMDPEDFSTNLTLYLKQPVRARVNTFKDPKQQGRIVIDVVKPGVPAAPGQTNKAKGNK